MIFFSYKSFSLPHTQAGDQRTSPLFCWPLFSAWQLRMNQSASVSTVIRVQRCPQFVLKSQTLCLTDTHVFYLSDNHLCFCNRMQGGTVASSWGIPNRMHRNAAINNWNNSRVTSAVMSSPHSAYIRFYGSGSSEDNESASAEDTFPAREHFGVKL